MCMFVFVDVEHFKCTTDLTTWLLMLIVTWGMHRPCLSAITSTLASFLYVLVGVSESI